MKRLISLIVSIIIIIALVGCTNSNSNEVLNQDNSGSRTIHDINSENEYYMIAFGVGLEFWEQCFEGFDAAADAYGVKAFYTGSQKTTDLDELINVFQQVSAKNPAGIAVTCYNPEAMAEHINAAIEKGIPVVTFDSDSAMSNRYSIISAGNINAGRKAGEALAEAIGGKGEVAVIFNAGIATHQERVEGMMLEFEEKYPNIKVVSKVTPEPGIEGHATAALNAVQGNPNINGIAAFSTEVVGIPAAMRELGKSDIKIVGFDTDDAVFEMIDSGDIAATIKQGTYNMGYWSLVSLLSVKEGLVNPTDGWKEAGISPLPVSIDAGTEIVTKENLQFYWGK